MTEEDVERLREHLASVRHTRPPTEEEIVAAAAEVPEDDPESVSPPGD